MGAGAFSQPAFFASGTREWSFPFFGELVRRRVRRPAASEEGQRGVAGFVGRALLMASESCIPWVCAGVAFGEPW
jgi:hypothetical protein